MAFFSFIFWYVAVMPCMGIDVFKNKIENEISTTKLISSTTLHQPEDKQILLKKGTLVTLRVLQNISSRDTEVGNLVNMEIATDIKADREVVLATGVYAEGKVTQVKKAMLFGNAGFLEIKAINVMTVDGQRIPLISQPLIKKGHNKKVLAWGLSIVSFIVGMIVPGNWKFLHAGSFLGAVIKGKAAIVPFDTLISAEIAKDAIIFKEGANN